MDRHIVLCFKQQGRPFKIRERERETSSSGPDRRCDLTTGPTSRRVHMHVPIVVVSSEHPASMRQGNAGSAPSAAIQPAVQAIAMWMRGQSRLGHQAWHEADPLCFLSSFLLSHIPSSFGMRRSKQAPSKDQT